MKKFLALLCVLALFLCLFSGCEKQEPKDSKELFCDFLQGEITALDKSGEATMLDGGFFKILSDKYTYCFIDMNGDGEDELCVNNPPDNMIFFTVKGGKVYYWYFTDEAYKSEITLLNNGAFLSKNPSVYYVKYKYYELDENGEEKFAVAFSKSDEVYLALEDRISPAIYKIDEKEVIKEEYEEKTNKYLEIGSDKIVWYDKDGNKV